MSLVGGSFFLVSFLPLRALVGFSYLSFMPEKLYVINIHTLLGNHIHLCLPVKSRNFRHWWRFCRERSDTYFSMASRRSSRYRHQVNKRGPSTLNSLVGFWLLWSQAPVEMRSCSLISITMSGSRGWKLERVKYKAERRDWIEMSYRRVHEENSKKRCEFEYKDYPFSSFVWSQLIPSHWAPGKLVKSS